MIKKFCTPTHLDKEDFGAWWPMDNGKIYVQTSPDKEHPLWVLLGDLFMIHVSEHYDSIDKSYDELAVVIKSLTMIPLEKESE